MNKKIDRNLYISSKNNKFKKHELTNKTGKIIMQI